MGASTFGTHAYAETAQKAYDALIKEAYYNHGHDPYNGTISTTAGEGFIMVPFLEGEDSVSWMDRAIDNPKVNKWGPCACVEATHVEKNDEGHSLWHFAGWAAE
jgi:hypothetical protein